MVFSIADEIGTTHAFESFAQQGPVVGIVIAQERLVQTAPPLTFDSIHLFATLVAMDTLERIQPGVIHRRGGGHRAGIESLHLISPKTAFLQPQSQIEHILVSGARMCGNEIRNKELLLTGLSAELFKHLPESVICPDTRLHHLGQRPLLGMFRRNLEVAAHMVEHQLPDIVWRLNGQVIPQAGADQHFLDAGQLAQFAVELDQRTVVGAQVLAHIRIDATGLAADRFDVLALAAKAVHVGRGTTQVRDDASKPPDLVPDILRLPQDAGLAAALDDASLVLGDRAKRASAKTAAHDVDTETDHFPSRDFGFPVVASISIGIRRVRAARIGQIEHPVHFGGVQWQGRRVDPDITRRVSLPMRLHQCARIAGIGFKVQHTAGMRV